MKMQRVVCGVVALSLAGGGVHVPVAQAALVGTEQVVAAAAQGQAVDDMRQHLSMLLARDDVAAALQGRGVDVEQARARVDSLSDAEVMQLHGQIDQLPAGGSVVGTAVFVFLVLLLTDILGFTDIFPFVKKTAR
jgi:hypothetical protein